MWPPSALSRETRALADFLCSAHDAGCRVKALNGTGLHARLRSLWRGGFVVRGTFIPTPEALDYWRKRRDKRNSAAIAQEPNGPPTPTAADAGGGAAREASPPKPAFPCGHERTPENSKIKRSSGYTRCRKCQQRYARECQQRRRLRLSKKEACELPDQLVAELSKAGQEEVAEIRREPEHAPAGAAGAAEDPNEPRPLSTGRPTGEALAAQLEAWCRDSGGSQIRLGLHLFGSQGGVGSLRRSKRPKQVTIDKVAAFLADPLPPDKLPDRQKPVRAPKINPVPAYAADDPAKAARRVQHYKNSVRRKARRLLDEGVSTSSTKLNAAERGAMNDIIRGDAELARAACPIEQAKTLIRRKGHNCFDACVIDGENKGKGHYYINRRRVNERELLAYAKELSS